MSELQKPQFSISIVSHGHQIFVARLIDDLTRLNRRDIEVILTWNLPEEQMCVQIDNSKIRFISIANEKPRGFAENHNTAFTRCTGENFVILNPDINLPTDPFPNLLYTLKRNSPCICAPIIKNYANEIEDSARFFPSPYSLAKKALAKITKKNITNVDNVPEDSEYLTPDWIAGMFMVIPRHVFENLSGLQNRYYLYYEDVDFCARAQLQGIKIYVTKHAIAIHHAQRNSHKSLKFFFWHIRSATRFFLSKPYITIMTRRLLKKF